MEPCPRITHLQLDTRSKEGVERIREIKQLTNFLSLSTALNPLASIFSKPIEASYNIGTYDWDLWSAAMQAIPQVRRDLIEKEARLQQIDHHRDPKQQRFWRAIEAGCWVQDLQPGAALRDREPRGSGKLQDGAGGAEVAASAPASSMASMTATPSAVRFVVSKATSELQMLIDGTWQGMSAQPSEAAPAGIYYTGREVDRAATLERPNVGPLLGAANGFVFQLLLPDRKLAKYPSEDLPLEAALNKGAISVAYAEDGMRVAALDQEQTQQLARGSSRSIT